MLLADELVDGARPHARGQRLRLAAVRFAKIVEEIDRESPKLDGPFGEATSTTAKRMASEVSPGRLLSGFVPLRTI